MSELLSLLNVGRVLERNLIAVGICSPGELRRVGAKEAFIRIRAIDNGACLHMLYGLQGAVEGIRDTELPESTKEDLRLFFRSL